MIIIGDALEELKRLEEKSINCCVTSPPYFGLRDYGHPGQIGLEETPEEFIDNLLEVFREVRRVLRDDGTLWLNLGDSYAGNGGHKDLNNIGDKQQTNSGSMGNAYRTPGKIGLKPKDMIGIPWKVAFALQADGWYLRQDIIWAKPNPMPESVRDRCTKAHEYIFLLSKSSRYFYDQEAIREPAGEKGNANSFRGGCYVNGNIDNSTMGKRTVSGNSKRIPSGWDTGPGSHKEKTGRYKNKANSFKRKTATEGKPGAPNQHREDREDIEYSGTRNKRDIWTIEDHNSLIQWLSETNPEILKQYLDVKPDVWTVSTKPYKGAHFATFPPDLIKPCILAGCPQGGVVLDPFVGSGTVPQVAKENDRDYIGIDIDPKNKPLIDERLSKAHYQHSF